MSDGKIRFFSDSSDVNSSQLGEVNGVVRRTRSVPSSVRSSPDRGTFTGYDSFPDVDPAVMLVMPRTTADFLTIFPAGGMSFNNIWLLDEASGSATAAPYTGSFSLTGTVDSGFTTTKPPTFGVTKQAQYAGDRGLHFYDPLSTVSASLVSQMNTGTGSFLFYAVVSFSGSYTGGNSIFHKNWDDPAYGYTVNFVSSSLGRRLSATIYYDGVNSVDITAVSNLNPVAGIFPIIVQRSGSFLYLADPRTGDLVSASLPSPTASLDATSQGAKFSIGQNVTLGGPSANMTVHYFAAVTGAMAEKIAQAGYNAGTVWTNLGWRGNVL